MATIDDLRKNPIVAVIRHSDPDSIIALVHALKEGGIRSVELTAETRGIEIGRAHV